MDHMYFLNRFQDPDKWYHRTVDKKKVTAGQTASERQNNKKTRQESRIHIFTAQQLSETIFAFAFA